jgi:hypothetical protein
MFDNSEISINHCQLRYIHANQMLKYPYLKKLNNSNIIIVQVRPMPHQLACVTYIPLYSLRNTTRSNISYH